VSQFELGGERVVVRSKSRYFWFYRRQGLSVEVSPDSHWWCLWLCTTTTEVDSIRCSMVLTSDVLSDCETSKSCSDCGSLTLWGPAMYGAGVPQAYQTVRYSGAVVISGVAYPFSGVEFFGTPPP
jgi:hypothetical protein